MSQSETFPRGRFYYASRMELSWDRLLSGPAVAGGTASIGGTVAATYEWPYFLRTSAVVGRVNASSSSPVG